jgi:hypothetical protein
MTRVAGCHFWLVGGCRETGIFRRDLAILPSFLFLRSRQSQCFRVSENAPRMAVRAVDCRSTPWLMLVMLFDHQDAIRYGRYSMMLVVQQVCSDLLT